MSGAQPQIRSQVVPLFLARLAAAGHDIGPIAERFSLPQEGMAERDIVVPLSVVRELPRLAEELMGDPHIGLHTADWLPRGAYGLLEFIMRSAKSMREAALRLVRYHTMLNDLTVLTLEERRHDRRSEQDQTGSSHGAHSGVFDSTGQGPRWSS